MDKLHNWNYWMMILHGVQAVVLIVLSFVNTSATEFKLPITSLFCNWDSGNPTQSVGFVRFVVLLRATAMQSMVSALGHGAVLQYWDRYTSDLRNGQNRFRWAEYSVSASILMTILFQVWGNLDWVQLSGCFVLSMAVQMFGDMHESINAGSKPDDVKWISIRYGALFAVIPWAIMLYEMIIAPDTSYIPWWAWLVVGEYFVLFMTFPGTMILQYMQVGKFDNALYPLLPNGGYIQGELQYQALSLFTKTLLTWEVAGVVLQPDSEMWNTLNNNLSS